MVEKESRLLLKVSKAFETALSIVLIIIIFLGMIDLVRSVYTAYIVDFANPVEYSQLNAFLAEALLLVIGVELVVMLSLHIPGALLEVLLYAIARKLILLPKTSGMGDLLLGIICEIGWEKLRFSVRNATRRPVDISTPFVAMDSAEPTIAQIT